MEAEWGAPGRCRCALAVRAHRRPRPSGRTSGLGTAARRLQRRASDGWIPAEQPRCAPGPRLHLPARLADRAARLRWRASRTGPPPAAMPYTRHPWVVANDRLRAAGWEADFSNEEAFVVADVGGFVTRSRPAGASSCRSAPSAPWPWRSSAARCGCCSGAAADPRRGTARRSGQGSSGLPETVRICGFVSPLRTKWTVTWLPGFKLAGRDHQVVVGGDVRGVDADDDVGPPGSGLELRGAPWFDDGELDAAGELAVRSPPRHRAPDRRDRARAW